MLKIQFKSTYAACTRKQSHINFPKIGPIKKQENIVVDNLQKTTMCILENVSLSRKEEDYLA